MATEIVVVNDREYFTNEAENKIDELIAEGKDAEVLYPDGARWLFCADRRCIKLNAA